LTPDSEPSDEACEANGSHDSKVKFGGKKVEKGITTEGEAQYS